MDALILVVDGASQVGHIRSTAESIIFQIIEMESMDELHV